MSYLGLDFIAQQQSLYSDGLCCTPCSFMTPSIFGGSLFVGNMFGMPYGNMFTGSLFGGGLNNIYGMPGCNLFWGTAGLPFTPAPQFGYIPPVNFSVMSLPSTTNYKNSFGYLTSKSKTTVYNTNTSLPSLQQAGYNKQKAQKLAAEIAKDSKEGGFDNLCAKHVKTAIQDAGLGKYQSGDGYQMTNILSKNKNFREIKVSGNDLSSLPAGCVLVYDRGVSGYSSKYGHTEITLGNGTAASGGITHNIRSGARVFIPV